MYVCVGPVVDTGGGVQLAATSYAESGGVMHTELMFKGLDSLKLGCALRVDSHRVCAR